MALLQWWQRERKKCLFPQFQAEINEFIHSPNHNPCHINLRCVRYNSTNATDTTLVNCYVIGGLATMNAGTSNDNLIIKSTDYEWTQQYRLWLFFPSSSFLERQQTTDTKKKRFHLTLLVCRAFYCFITKWRHHRIRECVSVRGEYKRWMECVLCAGSAHLRLWSSLGDAAIKPTLQRNRAAVV